MVNKAQAQQRLDWAVKQLMECRSTSATVACVAEHWGISRRQARGGTCLIGGTIHALERPSCQNHIYIQYEDTAGKKRKGLFRFQHKASGNAFLIDIELWSGMELRERGPSIKIVE